MRGGIRVLAIHQESGEEIRFERVSDAAKFAGVKSTTMSYRIRNRRADKNGYYYIAEELTPEQLERKNERMVLGSHKEFKSDDDELDPKFHILDYEVKNLRVSITPCPFKGYPKPMIGSGACLKCSSFRGRNKTKHQVACNRSYC